MTRSPLTTTTAQRFLQERRIAVVGATDREGAFGGAVYQALRDHGLAVVPVNPHATTVAGDPCFPDLASIPEPVTAVLVMVKADQSLGVAEQCVALGIAHVWLFKGIGGPGAVSDDAVRLLQAHGVTVVEGACPLMFLEPVAMVHRIHRGVRRLRGAVRAA